MSLRTLLSALTLPSEVTPFEATHLAKVNRMALVFGLLHLPVLMLVAFICDTGVLTALVLSALVLTGPLLARALLGPREASVVHGITSMCLGGLLVHFGQGPMQIEMHFYFFVLLALLVVFSNPRVILAAALTVVFHHLVLFLWLPNSIFNYQASFWAVLVHAGFVALETVAACAVARSFFDNVVGLERIVAQRTEELRRETEERKRGEALMAQTRERNAHTAGMAEVATGVLHNVGNALNSVGVAATVIGESLRKSKLASLGKATALLQQHLEDAPAFMATPQGRQLPGFLGKVFLALEEEQRAALGELETLQKGVAHMSVLVGNQQAHAKAGRSVSTTEPVSPGALVREALALALPAKELAGLVPQVDCGLEVPLALDRHRLLQVLVNLLRNANQALALAAAPALRVKVDGASGRLRFEVTDSGKGIGAEDKVKLFSHGFTTRPDGHGFGLHASACAAMEMGGSLRCESEGPGLGSTFILEVPLPAPAALSGGVA